MPPQVVQLLPQAVGAPGYIRCRQGLTLLVLASGHNPCDGPVSLLINSQVVAQLGFTLFVVAADGVQLVQEELEALAKHLLVHTRTQNR